MSENTAPQGDRPPAEPAPQGPASRRRPIALLIAGGVLALAMLGIFVVRPLLTGDPVKPARHATVATQPSSPTPNAAPEPTATATVTVEAFTDRQGRDPFVPLVRPVASSSASPTSSASPSSSATPSPSASPSSSPVPSGPGKG